MAEPALGCSCDGPQGETACRPAALDSGRTVLGWETREPIHGKRFSKVVLMGPYWSGTNAVREEVLWRFQAPVLNPDKLEVCAPTSQAVQSLREGLAHGPVVRDSLQVGQKRVPNGYKLLPHSGCLTSRSSHSRYGRGHQAGPLPPPRHTERPPRRPPEQPARRAQELQPDLQAGQPPEQPAAQAQALQPGLVEGQPPEQPAAPPQEPPAEERPVAQACEPEHIELPAARVQELLPDLEDGAHPPEQPAALAPEPPAGQLERPAVQVSEPGTLEQPAAQAHVPHPEAPAGQPLEQRAALAQEPPPYRPAAQPPAAGRHPRRPRTSSSLHETWIPLEPPVTVHFGPDTDGACPWWKHAVRLPSQGEMDTDEETLVVLVTKDPLFWLKSMSKHFYEIKVSEGTRRTGLDALFGELEHEGRRYCDAVELWSATMRSFLDEALYPSNRCVLLRYEDFLFRFWDVMVHLSAFLPVNGQRLKESPNSSRSKSHGREVRDRDEALRFYASRRYRHCDFAARHFERMRRLCPELLRCLGYEAPVRLEDEGAMSSRTLCTWVPALRPDDIVAARFQSDGDAVDGEEAAWSAERAWARVTEPQEDGEAASVKLLREVPCEWIVRNSHDWSIVEWPSERSRSSALGRACVREQRVPREWVDLRLPCARGTPSSVPLTEEGYRAAVSWRSTPKMAEFISRVIGDLEVRGFRAGRVLDRRRLMGFARWFSGEANVQSLAQIRRELPGKEAEHWVTFVPPRPTRSLKPMLPAQQEPEGEPAGVS